MNQDQEITKLSFRSRLEIFNAAFCGAAALPFMFYIFGPSLIATFVSAGISALAQEALFELKEYLISTKEDNNDKTLHRD